MLYKYYNYNVSKGGLGHGWYTHIIGLCFAILCMERILMAGAKMF